ncbi:MAG: hypothetical protein H0W30_15520 [Gemmatimonadaceae bacterium]|nr:hypothetical protein [Gemmatimonadaceae bacterium]
MRLSRLSDYWRGPVLSGEAGLLPWLPLDRKIAVVLFLTALAMYLPGIWWGLPSGTSPMQVLPWGADELGPLGPVAELYGVFLDPRPIFNPQYPLMHYMVLAVVEFPYLAWLKLTGGMAGMSATFPYGLSNPAQALAVMTLLARAVSWMMAAGVVVIAFRTAAILWNRTAGVFAAVLVMLAYPMIYYARTSNVDMASVFWSSLGLAVFAATLKTSLTPVRATWLGVFAALATATKDPSYAVFVAVGLVVVFRHIRTTRGRSWREIVQAPAAGFFAAVLVYVLASGLLFDFDRFLGHVKFITQGGSARITGAQSATPSGYLTLLWMTATHFSNAVGLPAAIFTLVGIVICAFREPRTLWFAVPALGLLLGVVVPVRFVMFRYIVLADYILVFFAAYVVAKGVQAQAASWCRISWAAFAVMVVWAAGRGTDLTFQMLHDSRYATADWFREHASAGDTIGYYGPPWKLPHLNADIRTLRSIELIEGGRLIELPVDTLAEIARPRFIIVMPVKGGEIERELHLSERVLRRLHDGSLGYRRALKLEPRYLFSRSLVSSVNPPVTVYVRQPSESEQRVDDR